MLQYLCEKELRLAQKHITRAYNIAEQRHSIGEINAMGKLLIEICQGIEYVEEANVVYKPHAHPEPVEPVKVPPPMNPQSDEVLNECGETAKQYKKHKASETQPHPVPVEIDDSKCVEESKAVEPEQRFYILTKISPHLNSALWVKTGYESTVYVRRASSFSEEEISRNALIKTGKHTAWPVNYIMNSQNSAGKVPEAKLIESMRWDKLD